MYLHMFLGFPSENQWHCKTDVYWRKENKLLGGLLLESTIPAPSCSQLTFLNFSPSSSKLEKTFQIFYFYLKHEFLFIKQPVIVFSSSILLYFEICKEKWNLSTWFYHFDRRRFNCLQYFFLLENTKQYHNCFLYAKFF